MSYHSCINPLQTSSCWGGWKHILAQPIQQPLQPATVGGVHCHGRWHHQRPEAGRWSWHEVQQGLWCLSSKYDNLCPVFFINFSLFFHLCNKSYCTCWIETLPQHYCLRKFIFGFSLSNCSSIHNFISSVRSRPVAIFNPHCSHLTFSSRPII